MKLLIMRFIQLIFKIKKNFLEIVGNSPLYYYFLLGVSHFFLIVVSVFLLEVFPVFGLIFVGFQGVYAIFLLNNSSFKNFDDKIFEDKTMVREYFKSHFPGVYLIISVLDIALFLIFLLFLVNPLWDELYSPILTLAFNAVCLVYMVDILFNMYILFKLYGLTPRLIPKVFCQCFLSFTLVLISWYFGPSALVFVRKLTVWMLLLL